MKDQILIIIIIFVVLLVLSRWSFLIKRKRRRSYYWNEYLKSDDWKRKRYVVLKRDNWRCVYCGAPATQVHHKKYARRNIGREPIEWLVSVCKSCHESRHGWRSCALFIASKALWRRRREFTNPLTRGSHMAQNSFWLQEPFPSMSQCGNITWGTPPCVNL